MAISRLLWYLLTTTCLCFAFDHEPKNGPVYVSLDNWVYPAFRRLAAMGYVPDADTLVLPWSRQQCVMLMEEAEDIASRRASKMDHTANQEALLIIDDLRKEFGRDIEPTNGVRVESLYTGLTQLGGKPLNDSYHFGQTISNDFGRPIQSGSNPNVGFSVQATAGRWSAYFRGEYQSAPEVADYSQSLKNLIGNLDGVPPSAIKSPASGPQFNALDFYVGAEIGPFDVTIGKQSLWWGPGASSGFAFSDNASPFYALRIRQSEPLLLPGVLRRLGRIRTEFVLGRLSGHRSPPGPWINAQKITLQLTEDFELGFTRSAIFAGEGHPFTTGSFLASLFSATSTGGTQFGSRSDPGDRRSGFDFRWRIPKLRRYLTLYSDSLADDEPNPLSNPKRSAWAPGLYITHLPGLAKLDFKVETYSTWLYRQDEGGRFIYWNDQYRDAYTNDGFLLGSWVGRDARAYVASSTYWWSGTNSITATYRQIKTGNAFLPGGGTQTDASITVQRDLGHNILGSFSVQGERYNIPVLGNERRNVAVSINLTYRPQTWNVR